MSRFQSKGPENVSHFLTLRQRGYSSSDIQGHPWDLCTQCGYPLILLPVVIGTVVAEIRYRSDDPDLTSGLRTPLSTTDFTSAA